MTRKRHMLVVMLTALGIIGIAGNPASACQHPRRRLESPLSWQSVTVAG